MSPSSASTSRESTSQDSSSPETIPPAALEQASLWMARLWSDDATDAQRKACLQWRQSAPEHERAWQQLQAIDGRLGALPRHAARSELFEASPQVSRRHLLQWGGVALLVSSLGFGLPRTPQWQRQFADYATGIGEMRNVTLSDGTQLRLDTDTAIDVSFDGHQRRLHLLRGGVLITTATTADARAFSVMTRDGLSYPVGTHFSVQQQADSTRVAVYEGRVALEQRGSPDRVMLNAGQQAAMSKAGMSPTEPLDPTELARFQGRLVAESMRVIEVLDTLARYRHGVVRCAPEVANRRVSGVFSLEDTDRALASLADALSLELIYRTPLWVALEPRSDG
ncbi:MULTISPECIES: FecR domain-containing protein [unclassified Halomonas]|uniref:FecR domain-containing protein n=1 Tax=unclassified Halomonas TaxID=2609666 RepID=UPI0009909FDD|nr:MULTISPECIES: FecR family protein [unclassified Halomonas]AQU81402.1 Fe(2+)-dicitrate sensor, transmembrane component [Halomonas sp. 'Soap Lake \